MSEPQAYKTLSALSKRAHLLEGISGLLAWDQETYMPEKAAPIRADQREILAELAHKIRTGSEFSSALSELIDLKTGEIKVSIPEEKASALKAWRRDYLRVSRLPTAFVQSFTKLTSEAIHVWQNAKNTNNFSLFSPYLERIVEELKKKADFIGYQDHPYDALIDEFEPGYTTDAVNQLFKELKSEIVSLVKVAAKKSKNEVLPAPFTEMEQIDICKLVLNAIGYDWTRGRLDLSAHPFSSSYHPDDCRITTRLDSHGFLTQILTTLHEAGHSLYEMGLPKEYFGTPLGEAVSLGIHESQSRFWETRIGRSKSFWNFLLPKLENKFPHKLPQNGVDTFLAEINQVSPSFIRTDADEVTYPLHVILRFEIEKELIEGKLKVKDLPGRWNSAMKELLGITPTSDKEGCLQDIHWSMGAFGYFPTYTLGNVYAASLFDVFCKDHPDWEMRVSSGDFEFIKQWHHHNVHRHGRRYNGIELIEQITKQLPTATPYIKYLKQKYGTN